MKTMDKNPGHNVGFAIIVGSLCYFVLEFLLVDACNITIPKLAVKPFQLVAIPAKGNPSL